MKTQCQIILSTCGTSLFTNGGSNEIRRLLRTYANEASLASIPEEDASILEQHVEECGQKLLEAKHDEMRRMSAELNGLAAIYNNHLQPSPGTPDVLLVMPTSTWIGKQAAQAIVNRLEQDGFQQARIEPADIALKTSNLEEFQLGLADLAKWALTNFETDYPRDQYRRIFNLTGGFKSVQGFLQVLGMLLQVETVTLFESTSEPLITPCLPIALEPDKEIKANLYTYRRLTLGLEVSVEEVRDLSKVLVFTIGDDAILSAWGEIQCQKSLGNLYSEEFLQPPNPSITWSDKFLKAVKKLPSDRLAIINRCMDDLSLDIEKGQTLARSRIKPIRGDHGPSSHELYAWSDKDAKRILLHYDGNRPILDNLVPHL